MRNSFLLCLDLVILRRFPGLEWRAGWRKGYLGIRTFRKPHGPLC
jgi:hypothetical protein